MSVEWLIGLLVIMIILLFIGVITKVITKRMLEDQDGLGKVHDKEENHILKL